MTIVITREFVALKLITTHLQIIFDVHRLEERKEKSVTCVN